MPRQFSIRGKAKREARDAREFLDSKRDGMGKEFKRELKALFDTIEADPFAFREIEPGVRRAVVERFHYVVFYAVSDLKIAVYAIIHQRRDPSYVGQRLAEEREEEL